MLATPAINFPRQGLQHHGRLRRNPVGQALRAWSQLYADSRPEPAALVARTLKA